MSDTVNDVPTQSGELVIFTVGIVTFAAVVSLACMCGKKRNEQAQQEQNIYNISGRVPGPNPTPCPDAYLSIEHISVTNELNKPPKYDDAPPSYEEAIKLAIAQSNSMQTLQAEQAQIHQGASSTSSSTPVVVPALPSRTTE